MPEVLTLAIESLAHGGDGIARAPDGKTVFVAGACPGDTVEAHITEERPSFARAITGRVLEPSSDRVEPRCPYFGRCGGCQWQHISYDAQLRAKELIARDTLGRIGGVDPEVVAGVVAAATPYGYRNKVELASVGGPALGLGFHVAGSSEVVQVDTCDLLPDEWRRAPKALRGSLRFLAGDGDLDVVRVAVRTSQRTGDSEIDVWTMAGPFPRKMAGKALADSLDVRTVTRVITREPVGARDVRGVEVLVGRGFWTERVGAHEHTVSAPSFFQVNTAQADRLVDAALDALAPEPTERVVDVYSGVGTFTLPLAERAGSVVALEGSGAALKDLRRNLEHHGLHAEVVPGDVAHTLAELGPADAVLVDPPRTGMSQDVVDGLVGVAPDRIVYVSCDPATLARDVGRLAVHGYQLTQASGVDLFPQTYHIETVARFDRGSPSPSS
jgi:23S rRNA (uracil1939-C5)-methyltransferase